MKTITSWTDLAANTVNEMGRTFMEALPNIIGALIVLLLGWLITKIMILVLKRLLTYAKIDRLTEIVNEKILMGKTPLKFNVTHVILIFIKWLSYLVFLIIAADIMNWEIVSREVGNLLRYLPRLFSAIALFMVGLYIANFIQNAIKGIFESFDLRGSKLVGTLVFYAIAFIITVTALNQAGVNTDIITSNTTIILAAFLAAIALSVGLGSKDVVRDILRTSYARKNFKIGQKVHYKEITGTIVTMANLSIGIETENGIRVIPIHKIMEEDITIKK